MFALRERATLVWGGLMALTCVTTWGMTKDLFSSGVAVTAIFLIAAIKVLLVMSEFMELRHAPWQVRTVFGGWVVVVTSLILGFWFVTPNAG